MKLNTHYINAHHNGGHLRQNWRENFVNDSLYYSYRSTEYDRQTYPNSMHYHDYYEIVVYLHGDVHYLCEGRIFRPQPGDVVLIPPGRMHMSVLDADETRYDRHVFYLYPNAFDPVGGGALTDFLTESAEGGMRTSPGGPELLRLLPQLNDALARPGARERALAMGLLMEIFYRLGSGSDGPEGSFDRLPDNVRAIQTYLDENFARIQSVSDVANHFYYSREYLSRLFRRHFNITVADYLANCRVACSQQLIRQGVSLCDACYQSGFRDLSTFIRTFRSVSGMTPSAYRKQIRGE